MARKFEDTTGSIIRKLKKLINSKGYIYALCMILFEDFHYDLETLQDQNPYNKLNMNEAAFIVGLLISNKLDFSLPNKELDIIEMKYATYKLMRDLHDSYALSIQRYINREPSANFQEKGKELFSRGSILTEAIFYSGTGCYENQYLELLRKRYRKDQDWLEKHYLFKSEDINKIVLRIKSIHDLKTQKIDLFDISEQLSQFTDRDGRKLEKKDIEKTLQIYELYQYHMSFNDNQYVQPDRQEFCRNLLNLFIIPQSEIQDLKGIESFLSNFSMIPGPKINSNMLMGSYNEINSHPLIKIDESHYFVPIPFLLSQAVYESPFYWMHKDVNYRQIAAINRGNIGETIVYDILIRIFGEVNTFRNIKIVKTRKTTLSEIDIISFLGNKAICVQVKSKKLTELSRQGDDESIKKDFREAFQEAYDQGIVCRKYILDKSSEFKDSNDEALNIPKEIDEVYLLCVTTENYPSMTFQSLIMLNKQSDDPYPLILSIFDLDIIGRYLSDPYDFLYYVRQRTTNVGRFISDEEINFLAFHLKNKLRINPDVGMVIIDSVYNHIISKDYLRDKHGLSYNGENPKLNIQWKSENLNRLCHEIAENNLKLPQKTDIIFYLFDWSDVLIPMFEKYRQMTENDGKDHNCTYLPNQIYENRLGITYYFTASADILHLKKGVLTLSYKNKYQNHIDYWIGLGSSSKSTKLIDLIVVINKPWEYDKEFEEVVVGQY